MKCFLALPPSDPLFKKSDYRTISNYHRDIIYISSDTFCLENGYKILVEIISCDKRFKSIDDYLTERYYGAGLVEYRLLVKINKIYSYNEIKKLLMLQ